MKPLRSESSRMSRRFLLKQLSLAPLLLRPASLFGCSLLGSQVRSPSEADFAFAGSRYQPHYPVGSPLESVLHLVTPGLDEYRNEKHAYEIGLILQSWGEALRSGNFAGVERSLHPALHANSLTSAHETRSRKANGIGIVQRTFAATTQTDAAAFQRDLAAWVGPQVQVSSADFAITALEPFGEAPTAARSSIRFSLVTQQDGGGSREQRIGTWLMEWVCGQPSGGVSPWRVTKFQAVAETRTTLHGPGFVDVSREALGEMPSYAEQMLHGADYWRTVLDGASGIDVYGNNGIAAGDFDNDGLDDLYVSQPAGLPNRLYHNRGDGTFEDVTDRAGVGVLDNTACALFADFRNRGWQDLLVVCGGGPLLFLNEGNGTFTLKKDAFRFAQPPLGTFTHAALADYDRDGRLDIYFCLYSYYLGLDQYHYPAPYFDARNGPANFLMQNQGDGTFADRTEASGLSVENDRYSFACAWGDADGSGAPDLYVVNDFGRNNLYRNLGNGTFRAVSETAHVQDVGAGMSASWVDFNNDGQPDLYAANMWSAAGQRVSQQAQFHANAPAGVRELYRRHATGNALYSNQGGAAFDNVSDAAGAAMGRWAWCSDFWDFDHDGYADLYVTNGYITATATPRAQADKAKSAPGSIDLDSFFWRQVVGRSPEDATPSLAYERGWNALNELIRSDSSWNGSERNVLLANNGDGTFYDVSGALGMDFLEDGRSFALADLDGDGRLEIIVKSRNAPQLRVMRNSMADLGECLVLRLQGTQSNRDAIGTKIVLQAGSLRQTRWLQAGSGFLAQHTKEVFFGLGKTTGPVTATVHWPSGLMQTFAELPRNARVDMVEGRATVSSKQFARPASSSIHASAEKAIHKEMLPVNFGTWLLDPLKAPDFSLPDRTGNAVTLASKQGSEVLLHLWSGADDAHKQMLNALDAGMHKAPGLQVLALNLDLSRTASQAEDAAAELKVSFPLLFATEDVAGRYNIIFRYLFDRRADLPLPVSFLLDRSCMIVKVYQGALHLEMVIADVRAIPQTAEDRAKVALPFPGTLHHGAFRRNDFTYGVAMFQHGYLDEAAASFQQVLLERPDDAEAHYNLGTLNLRRKDLEGARQHLQRSVDLKPNYPEAWNNLGLIAGQENRVDEALHCFQRSLEQRPTYVTALVNLGNLYRHEQAFDQAKTYLTRALQLQPDDPETNYSLGMLYAQQDDVSSASTYLQTAIHLRADYPEALNNFGVLLVREQQYLKAEQQFQTCVHLVPGYEASYLNLYRLYLLQHDKSKARQALEELLRVHPESAAGRRALQVLDQTS